MTQQERSGADLPQGGFPDSNSIAFWAVGRCRPPDAERLPRNPDSKSRGPRDAGGRWQVAGGNSRHRPRGLY
jgi:hypothetical protein